MKWPNEPSFEARSNFEVWKHKSVIQVKIRFCIDLVFCEENLLVLLHDIHFYRLLHDTIGFLKDLSLDFVFLFKYFVFVMNPT